MGTGASWNGEPRLIWGITRIFNAVSNFVSESNIFSDELAGKVSQNIGALHHSLLYANTHSELTG